MQPHSELRQARRAGRLRRVAGLVMVLGVALLLGMRYRLVWVVGDSMVPTFQSGDLIVVDRWAYHRREPGRGDVVVARHHGEWVLKRVVGLPGESVEVREGQVEVDGSPLDPDHPVTSGSLNIGSARLLSHRFAILGDNRGVDPGSFIHAVVGPEQLLGRVVLPGPRLR